MTPSSVHTQICDRFLLRGKVQSRLGPVSILSRKPDLKKEPQSSFWAHYSEDLRVSINNVCKRYSAPALRQTVSN